MLCLPKCLVFCQSGFLICFAKIILSINGVAGIHWIRTLASSTVFLQGTSACYKQYTLSPNTAKVRKLFLKRFNFITEWVFIDTHASLFLLLTISQNFQQYSQNSTVRWTNIFSINQHFQIIPLMLLPLIPVCFGMNSGVHCPPTSPNVLSKLKNFAHYESRLFRS